VDSFPTTEGATEVASSPAPISRVVRRVRLVTAILWTLVILGLCWLPAPWLRKVEGGSSWFKIPNLDKPIHWGIFFVFAVLWLRVGESQRRYAWVALAGLALSAITELIQNLPIVGRDGNLADFATDIIAVIMGLALARSIEPFPRYVESRVFPESTG
jgi:hypothetical protein